MTKKQMQARITELETLVASLNAAVAALSTTQHPIYVGPLPTQPTVFPLPQPTWPPSMPYIGDGPLNLGPTIICGGTTLTQAGQNVCRVQSTLGEGCL